MGKDEIRRFLATIGSKGGTNASTRLTKQDGLSEPGKQVRRIRANQRKG